MRLFLAAALLTIAAPVLAQAPVAQRGAMLRDSESARLGSIQSVDADGSVKVIVNSRIVRVPASSLTVVDGKLVTSMTKKQLASAH